MANLRTHNGLLMIWRQGHPNHCAGRDVLLIALYRQIGEVAPARMASFSWSTMRRVDDHSLTVNVPGFRLTITHPPDSLSPLRSGLRNRCASLPGCRHNTQLLQHP